MGVLCMSLMLAAASAEPGVPVDVARVTASRVDLAADGTAAASARELPDRLSVFQDAGITLRTIPGLQVQRTGGPYAFIGVSIRGADTTQTSVFVGDLEISGPSTGAFDLSILPLAAFDRVEVFRGGAPAWLSSSAIGGVVRFVPRQVGTSSSTARVEGGGGSYETAFAGFEVEERRSGVAVVASGGFTTTAGDYPFVFDPTPLVDGDDRVLRRRNADATQVSGTQASDFDVGPGKLQTVLLAVHRQGGEPGSGVVNAEEARRERSYVFGSAGYTARVLAAGRPLTLQAATGVGLDYDRFEDLGPEIGLVADQTTTEAWAFQLRTAARYALLSWLDMSFVGVARWDRLTSENELSSSQLPPGRRSSQTGTLELFGHHAWGERYWELRAWVRGQATQTEGTGLRGDGSTLEVDSRRGDPSTRIATRLDVLRGLAFRASWSYGQRYPTFLELFGDRAVFVPNPALEPEVGHAADMGVLASWSSAAFELALEVTAFGTWLDDLVRLQRTSQFTFRSANTASGRILGIETGLRASFTEHLRVTGNLTGQDADDEAGTQLPFRARWLAYGDFTVATGPFSVVDDLRFVGAVTHRSSVTLGSAALVEIDPFTTFDVGLEADLLGERVALYGRVYDLFNQALNPGVSDILSFPVPGRRFEIGLQVRQTW